MASITSIAFGLILMAFAAVPTSAQSQRLITWDSVGQRYTIQAGEIPIDSWNIDPENKYIHFTPRSYGYDIELRLKREVETALKVRSVRSVSLENIKNASPNTDTAEKSSAIKEFTFEYIGHREKILFGETINVKVIKEAVAFDTYFSFESDIDGYWIELANINSVKRLRFDCICKTFIVQSPKMADINFDNRLNLEQIIWTPRVDGTWEVRLGNVQRGCDSPALRKLPSLRSPEYEKNKPTCGAK